MRFIIHELVADGVFKVELVWGNNKSKHFEMHLFPFPDSICFSKLTVARDERKRVIAALDEVTDDWLDSVLDQPRNEARLISDHYIDVGCIEDMSVEHDILRGRCGELVGYRRRDGGLQITTGIMTKESIIQLLRQDLCLSSRKKSLYIPYED